MLKKELEQELNRTKLILDYAREEIKEKDKEIERLNSIIKDIEDYINFLVIYNQTISGKFSETQWGQDILGLIGSDKE